jgi:hypothetical protein
MMISQLLMSFSLVLMVHPAGGWLLMSANSCIRCQSRAIARAFV